MSFQERERFELSELPDRFKRSKETLKKNRLKLTADEEAIIDGIVEKNLTELRKDCGIGKDIFVEIEEHKIGWHYSLFHSVANTKLVMKFIYDANTVEFIQLMAPLPSAQARFVPMTTSILANCVSRFLLALEQSGDATAALFYSTLDYQRDHELFTRIDNYEGKLFIVYLNLAQYVIQKSMIVCLGHQAWSVIHLIAA